MIIKILYYIRVFSFTLFLFLCTFILDDIFKTGIIGILFLICLFLYIIVILLSHLSKKDYYIKTVSYNLTIIFLSVYFGIINVILFLEKNDPFKTYTINKNYLQMNFIFLSCMMIGIIINTFLLYLYNKEITLKELFKENNS